MQAIYWVMSWACHRRCKHCYDDRFRPYVRDDLTRVIGEGQAAWPRILANLPDDMSYVDTDGARKPTLIVLAGGEPLIDGFREDLFYPLLEGIAARWPDAPGTARPRVAIQTTGDIMTGANIDEMLARGVTSIAIASIDDYHVGHQGEGKFRLMEKVRALMAARGVKEVSLGGEKLGRLKAPAPGKVKDGDPTFLFFGAQPDLWIGELWPRGRAWANGLSDATYETNFCARWSGGKNFLKYGQAGSEVAIEPDGSIYPCCLKTKAPLGSLAEERLTDILDDLADEPALQAIDKGDPEAMGLDTGWSRDDFRIAATQPDGKGRQVANVCLGCDAYFEKVLGDVLERRRKARMAMSD